MLTRADSNHEQTVRSASKMKHDRCLRRSAVMSFFSNSSAAVSFSGQPGPTYDQNVISGVRQSHYQASISGVKQGRSVHITSEIKQKQGRLTSWSNCNCRTERAVLHDIVVISETKQGRAVSHHDCAVMSETKQGRAVSHHDYAVMSETKHGHLRPWLTTAVYVQSISMSL